MCSMYPIGEMSVVAWERAAEIYAYRLKIGKPLEDADILTAAFCIVGGCILVTNNTKHFDVIDGLQLVNWTE